MEKVTRLVARVDERDQPTIFHGRVAWAVNELIEAGPTGCTPITHPGPRWSDYIMKARRQGVNIETRHEGHKGAYQGHHGRYILRSVVEVIEKDTAA